MPKVSVRKSIVIDAPLEKVYEFVRNFKEWPAWSPWLITDPECKVSYADDGGQYTWEGDVVGAGEMSILSEEKPNEIVYQLTFLKPFKSQAGVAMNFALKGGGIEVAWSMDSKLPFFLFFMRPMMTAIIGMDYERGLRMLKELLETGSAGSKLEFPGEEAMPAQDYVGLRSAASIAEMGEAMEYDMKKLHDWVAANEVELAGTPFTIYHQWNPTKATTEYTLGFPLGKPLDSLPDGFVAGERPACRAFSIKHTGSYCHLGNAWSSGINRARNKVFRQSKTIAPFEIYENSPAEVSEEELETTVYFPLRD